MACVTFLADRGKEVESSIIGKKHIASLLMDLYTSAIGALI